MKSANVRKASCHTVLALLRMYMCLCKHHTVLVMSTSLEHELVSVEDATVLEGYQCGFLLHSFLEHIPNNSSFVGHLLSKEVGVVFILDSL